MSAVAPATGSGEPLTSTRAVTSAASASRSCPAQGPGSVAKTSSARLPVNSERSGESQPRASKNARYAARCTGSESTSVPSRSSSRAAGVTG